MFNNLFTNISSAVAQQGSLLNQSVTYPEHLILTFDGSQPILSVDGTKVLTFNGWEQLPENLLLTFDGSQALLSPDGTQYLTTNGFV